MPTVDNYFTQPNTGSDNELIYNGTIQGPELSPLQNVYINFEFIDLLSVNTQYFRSLSNAEWVSTKVILKGPTTTTADITLAFSNDGVPNTDLDIFIPLGSSEGDIITVEAGVTPFNFNVSQAAAYTSDGNEAGTLSAQIIITSHPPANI